MFAVVLKYSDAESIVLAFGGKSNWTNSKKLIEKLVVLVKYFHAPPDMQKSSVFQMIMIYLFKNCSSISTGNLLFFGRYLFSWNSTWVKVRLG